MLISVQLSVRSFPYNYLFLEVDRADELFRYKRNGKIEEVLEGENNVGSLMGILVFVETKRNADFIIVFFFENNN